MRLWQKVALLSPMFVRMVGAEQGIHDMRACMFTTVDCRVLQAWCFSVVSLHEYLNCYSATLTFK